MDTKIDPKWLGSLFGIIAFAVSCMVFIYTGNDFFYATITIIVSSICFYMFGIAVAIIFNYITNSKVNQNNI